MPEPSLYEQAIAKMKSLEKKYCFREGRRNNDIVNWTLSYMILNKLAHKSFDLSSTLDSFYIFMEIFTLEQFKDLREWEDTPEHKIEVVYNRYSDRSPEELCALFV